MWTTTFQKEEWKIKAYVGAVNDTCGMYLSLRQLYELNYPYNSTDMYVCSDWNIAYYKWDGFR